MKPRKLLKRIAVWRYIKQADGFGGSEAETGVKVTDSWCNIKSVPTSKLIDYGLDETKRAITVTVRHRADLDYHDNDLYLVYQSVEYTINRVTEKNINGYHFELLAST